MAHVVRQHDVDRTGSEEFTCYPVRRLDVRGDQIVQQRCCVAQVAVSGVALELGSDVDGRARGDDVEAGQSHPIRIGWIRDHVDVVPTSAEVRRDRECREEVTRRPEAGGEASHAAAVTARTSLGRSTGRIASCVGREGGMTHGVLAATALGSSARRRPSPRGASPCRCVRTSCAGVEAARSRRRRTPRYRAPSCRRVVHDVRGRRRRCRWR